MGATPYSHESEMKASRLSLGGPGALSLRKAGQGDAGM